MKHLTVKWLNSMRTKVIVTEVEETDAVLPAMGIRIYPRVRGRTFNTMSWYVRTGRGSNHRRKVLGRYPRLSIKEARRLAVAFLEGPAGDAPHVTFETLSEAYWAHLQGLAKKGQRGGVTWRESKRVIDKDVMPTWRKLDARTITPAMVRVLHLKVAARAPRTADYVKSVLSGMFRFARSRLLDGMENPAAGIENVHREHLPSRDLGWDEIVRLWKACNSDGSVGARAVQVGLMTGLRRNAALGGDFSEIQRDVQEGSRYWWEIPRVRMMKGGKPLLVYLSPLALQAIGTLPGDSSVMFPNRRGRRLQRIDEVLVRLRAEAGIHDLNFKMLRTTYSTRLAELGAPSLIRMALMGQAHQSVQEKHYNKYEYRNEKVEWMNLFDSHLQDLLGEPATVSFRFHRQIRAS